jgi:hypothetical protein
MTASPAPLPTPKTDLIANVFDALPLPAFVVDRDFNIIDFNFAGSRLLDRVPFAVLRLRGGEQVRCIHTIETEGEDGTAACEDCRLKNFVREVFAQSTACRKTGRLRLARDGQTADQDLLITVAPIPDESEPLALMVLDDAAELSALLELAPGSKGRSATPVFSSPDSKARAKVRGRRTDNS